MHGVRLLEDWTYSDSSKRWVLKVRLTVDVPAGSEVPPETDWYVLAADSYPWGSLRVMPAQEHGIAETYWHQNHNAPPVDEDPWRQGEICLRTTVNALGRSGLDEEKFTGEDRLAWNLDRARSWLKAAATGGLVRIGEPFELPMFPGSRGRLPIFAFSEGNAGAPQNLGPNPRFGLMELADLVNRSRALACIRFQDAKGKVVREVPWGDIIRGARTHRGAWAWLDLPPVGYPWEAPRTWRELETILKRSSLSLWKLLDLAAHAGEDEEPKVIALGFGIPKNIGDPQSQRHWQALRTPVLWQKRRSHSARRPRLMRVPQERTINLDEAIEWLSSENWHPEELTSRGRLPRALTVRPIILIGAGALGSAVAELLVRGGIQRFHIFDPDFLHAGNLVRHTLTLGEIEQAKAMALATRLRAISPHVEATHEVEAMAPGRSFPVEGIPPLVVDCSGENVVWEWMAQQKWPSGTLFASLSVGWKAKRLFLVVGKDKFSAESARGHVDPWLQQEAEDAVLEDPPREATGCWDPVFPARADRIWSAAAISIGEICRRVIADQMEGADVYDLERAPEARRQEGSP